MAVQQQEVQVLQQEREQFQLVRQHVHQELLQEKPVQLHARRETTVQIHQEVRVLQQGKAVFQHAQQLVRQELPAVLQAHQAAVREVVQVVTKDPVRETVLHQAAHRQEVQVRITQDVQIQVQARHHPAQGLALIAQDAPVQVEAPMVHQGVQVLQAVEVAAEAAVEAAVVDKKENNDYKRLN